MNKKLTFLLALTFLFLFSGCGQKQEVKREYWDNGKLKSETHYKNGEKDGLKTFWDEKGKKWGELHYKNGFLRTTISYYREIGKKKVIVRVDESLNTETLYYHKNGKKKSYEICDSEERGIDSCKLTEWDENGRKTYEGNGKY